MKRFSSLVTLGMIVALIVAACGGGDPTATPRPAPTNTPAPSATAVPLPQPTATPAAPAAKRGGVLVQGDRPTASRSFQDTIRNAELGPAHNVATRLIYQTLFHFDPYNEQKFAGMLGSKAVFSPSADQLTIELDPDARWADGKPVTATDVKFNFDTFANPPDAFIVARSAKTIGGNIANIEVVDARVIRITLAEPNVSLLSLIGDPQILIRPAHRTLEQSATDPVGSGPYMIKDVQIDVKFTFERNPNFWMKDAKGDQLPYLDGVENIILSDAERAFAAVLTGQVHVLNNIWVAETTNKVDTIRKNMPNATIQNRTSGNIGWGTKNVEPFNDPKVQQALSILTDRLSLVELAFSGNGVIDGIGVLPASVGGEWSLPSEEILSTPGWRYLNKTTGELETDPWALQQGLSNVYEKDPADIELALKLLKEAGLDPFPSLTVNAGSRYEARALAMLEPLGEAVGIRIKYNVTDTATNRENNANGKFQATCYALHPASLEPSVSMRFFLTGSGLWNHGFELPELDALYAKQNKAVDPAQRKDLLWELQRMILGGVNIIPGANNVGPSGLVREWVIDFPMPVVTQSNVWSLERVWIDPDKM